LSEIKTKKALQDRRQTNNRGERCPILRQAQDEVWACGWRFTQRCCCAPIGGGAGEANIVRDGGAKKEL